VDRKFDYAQKILLAVEYADVPQRMEGMPAAYALFKRLSIPEVVRTLEEKQSSSALPIGSGKFQNALDQRMGYWEKRVADGKHCFVHYAIGTDDVITAAFDQLKGSGSGFVLLGIYHVEPQSSAYPYSFPVGITPDHWRLGQYFSLTDASVFWFNFFPEQPYVFERTFAVWAQFQVLPLKERAENNQLVSWEGNERLIVRGISEFVQVNLNRFTSLSGFLNAAREAGEHTFTDDTDYVWYGMLLRKL
jgi:hypothetical protein